MQLNGLHLLLTYQCTFECDHCFVWGSPFQSGVMTLENIRDILSQAKDTGTIEWIYFEGGEPTLFYPILLKGVCQANEMGFKIGIVSNAYWATSLEDALEWLQPFAGHVGDLSVSSDLFHYSELLSQQVRNATQAAEQLGIPVGTISIAQPDALDAEASVGQIPLGQSGVMYRGRAAEKLAGRAVQRPWHEFTACPYEDLRDPGRLHLDPFGYLHICQGISIGNLYQQPLTDICARYDPDNHPICGPLLSGGPVELLRRYGLAHDETYADACHLCDQARRSLRQRFPEILAPDQMYGVAG
ncbi:MAG: 4Fe-4S cluster-binding domain-containing protein [Anaerolineales bacterium]|nr:4Fe-4S cluster-binding domain-containing protein [Anaerolineales bacterium]